ncbi:MAG: efflux RND transporter periplasmic adaptor subunit [bacterium]
MKRILLLVLVVVVVLVAVFFRIRAIESKNKETKKGITQINRDKGFPVVLSGVSVGEFSVWREVPGKVHGDREAYLNTPDLAQVDSIEYRVGEMVPAFSPVIRLNEDDPKNTTRVKLLRKVYEEAKSDYQSYKRLAQQDAVPRDAVDKMKLKMESAKSDLDQALSTVDLSSPFRGMLVALYAREGERVKPRKTLAMVATVDKVRINAKLSEQDMNDMEEGQPVRVGVDEKVLEGTVDRVSKSAGPKSGLFSVELLIDNPQHVLKVGTYVTTEVRVFHQEKVPYIDTLSILRDRKGNSYIYQVKGGKAVRVPIEVKARNQRGYSHVSGLDPDLPVVVTGQERLKDGVKVREVSGEVAE